MEQQDELIIPFRGLALEVHHFHYDIDAAFFEELENSELQQGDVKVDLALDRQERMLILDFDIRGSIEVDCDRCLEPFAYPVEGRRQLIIKFGDHYEEEDDDIMVIPEAEYQIDVSRHIYDYIFLMLPLRKVHPDDEEGNPTCNTEMLSRLERHSGQTTPDSRWDALNDLKKKFNDKQ